MGRHVRIACLGDGRDWVVRLACLCVEETRPDDEFEFMLDGRDDPAAARVSAVCVESLWNDLPNVATAHVRDLPHQLLLGADLVADLSACASARQTGAQEAAPGADDAPEAAPRVLDWDDPTPSSTSPRLDPSLRLGARERHRLLELDMSLLCPHAVLLEARPTCDFDQQAREALRRALSLAGPSTSGARILS